MSNNQNKPTPQNTASPTAPLTDYQVAEYLESNPEFFEKHLDLLMTLRLSHPSGNAISLIEKQVHTYRERNSNIREKLNVLLANARENDRLFELSQRLTLSLIECTELGDIFDALSYSLDQEFKVKFAAIWVLNDKLNSATTHFWSENEFHPLLNERLKSGKTAFSGISKKEVNALFNNAHEIGSAAMSIVRHGSHPIAIIAVGHEDPERYQPNGGTLFLRHLSELLSRVLAKFL